jgi:hypothetical protein
VKLLATYKSSLPIALYLADVDAADAAHLAQSSNWSSIRV